MSIKKAKKIFEIAKTSTIEKIAQVTHSVSGSTNRVGGDAFMKELEAVTGTFSMDNGGIRSFNDQKKQDERRAMLKEIPKKHHKAFESAMDQKDPANRVLEKLKILKSKMGK